MPSIVPSRKHKARIQLISIAAAQQESRKSRRKAMRTAAREDHQAPRAGTLLRGLLVLEVLRDAGQPLNLSQIAQKAALDQSTALRILRTLENAKQVIRLRESKRYSCSPKALRPLSLLHPLEQLRRETSYLLNTLATEVGQTIVLVVFLEFERCVIDVIQRPGSVSPYYDTWLQGPLHGSGPGKALLLTLSSEQRRKLLGVEPFRKHTNQTITTYKQLEADLARARARGYSVVRDEFYERLTAISTTFSTLGGVPLGCIAVTGHSHDLTDVRVREIGLKIRGVAKMLPMQAPSVELVQRFIGR